MAKKNPSGRFLHDAFGSVNSRLPPVFYSILSSIHHGLADVPLQGIYSQLNLEEALAFAIGSYHLRKQKVNEFHCIDQDFITEINNSSLYDLFRMVNSSKVVPYLSGNFEIPGHTLENPYLWINSVKSRSNLSDKDIKDYRKMNPFKNRPLAERLSVVDDNCVNRLKSRMQDQVGEYVFEKDCEFRKRLRAGNNHNLHIMRFQKVFPDRKKVEINYSKEIARLLKSYDNEFMESCPSEIFIDEETARASLDYGARREMQREWLDASGIPPELAPYVDIPEIE